MAKKFILPLLLCLLLCACSAAPEVAEGERTLQDALGNIATLPENPRVVSCYGSFAECWLLSGGKLVGVTKDAIEEHGLDTGDAKIIGTVKNINLESLVALDPDYIILSADLSAHLSLQESLDAMGLSYGYFRMDDFSDYKALMGQFCALNGGAEAYAFAVERTEKAMEDIKNKLPPSSATYLLMRAYSTGIKVKGDDNQAGQILHAFGMENLANALDSNIEELSLEYIIQAEPDYIFILPMGDEDVAKAYVDALMEQNPAFRSLHAVEKGQLYILPKNLFHYKPNHRWGESYAYLAKILYPELFPA